MPRCLVDAESAPPNYLKCLKALRKKHRRIDRDLEEAFREIEKDYSTALNAVALSGRERKVWKYRVRSRDQRKGSQGAFRLFMHLDYEENGTMRPLLLLAKSDQSDASASQIADAVASLEQMLKDEPQPGTAADPDPPPSQ